MDVSALPLKSWDGARSAEYREHAGECRKLAQTARNEMERAQLLQMAAAWERMAADRQQKLNEDRGLA